MKLFTIIAALVLASCSKPNAPNDCDDVTFVHDNYVKGVISGYMFTGTDTIWQHQNYCGAQLDSLLNIVQPYDSISGNNLYTFRYVFLNHNF